MKGLVTYSINIIAGVSISIMATILTSIIVTTSGSKENINDATKMDNVENGKSLSKYKNIHPCFYQSIKFCGVFLNEITDRNFLVEFDA